MGTISHRSLSYLQIYKPTTFSFLFHRIISNLPNPNPNPNPNPRTDTTDLCNSDQTPNPPPAPPQNFNPRTRTPLEKQFETWIHNLKPGFTPADVNLALHSQSDPDLALDIFRWTAQQRRYKHDHATYETMIRIAVAGKRYGHAETLVDEVLSGACSGSVSLYNSIIKFCCRHNHLFNRAFDVFRKMQRSDGCKPSLETYTMLLNAVLRKFSRLNVCYVYLPAVRSLLKQMRVSGVIPDTFALNLIIKAYSKCLEMDEALRIFREMGLYGCKPDGFTYSYMVKGLCEKGNLSQGLKFYREMRDKGLVPSSSSYMALICSLSLGRMFDDSIGILFDMLANSMVPDVLTYRTVLEGLCREGRGKEAFELLEELRKKEGSISDSNYKNLLDQLYLLSRE